MPSITIITVCFNSIETISNTLNSIKKQNKDFFEYIIIDGGSKDGTLEILNKNKNFIDILVSKPDKGIYDAMNKGIQYASSPWVMFLNSGDVLFDEHTLEGILDTINQNQLLEIWYGGVISIDTDMNSREIGTKKFKKSFVNYMDICHQGIIFKKDLFSFDKNGLYDISFKICADQEWMARLYSSFTTSPTFLNMTIATSIAEGYNTIHFKKKCFERFKIAKKYGTPSERLLSILFLFYNLIKFFVIFKIKDTPIFKKYRKLKWNSN